MTRNHCYSALILRNRPSGESNREAWLLTAEAGLMRATVFGGPKSKLRSCASPFHSGRAWVYHDPAKDSRKLSDFDVSSWRPGLREQYERMVAADAVAETVLASHGGGGNWGGALSLAESALDALADCGGESCPRVLACFFWQWIGFLGLRPEFESCCQCGAPVPSGSRAFFSCREGGALCGECAGPGQGAGLVEAGPGCRRWLETVRKLPPSQLGRFTLDAKSLSEATALGTAILAEAFGKRLASWDY